MAIQGVRHGLRARGSFNVGVKLDGQWLKFNQLVNTLDIEMAGAAKLAQRKFAEKYKRKLQTNIRTGGRKFGYPGHSSKYSQYKSRHGGPSKQLYWSGAMGESIEIVGLAGGRVGVGIPKNKKRENYFAKERNQLTISEYANILEQGSPGIGIKARPIFKDTFKEDMKGLKGLKSLMQWHLVREFSKKGIRVNKI